MIHTHSLYTGYIDFSGKYYIDMENNISNFDISLRYVACLAV